MNALTIDLLSRFKRMLTLVGRQLSGLQIEKIQATLNYLHTGRWMEDRSFRPAERVRNREEVWKQGLLRLETGKILYMEFGVAAGVSLKFWSRHLQQPDAVLHGFDSFTGMPEDGGPWRQGQFDMKGALPKIDDPRVALFAGWFNETLPTYEVPSHNVLVLNMDADLYSSTIYVLRHLQKFIQAGTLIYFDEMNHPTHEPRAFDEFMKETGLTFRLVSADRTLAHQFYECTGLSSVTADHPVDDTAVDPACR